MRGRSPGTVPKPGDGAPLGAVSATAEQVCTARARGRKPLVSAVGRRGHFAPRVPVRTREDTCAQRAIQVVTVLPAVSGSLQTQVCRITKSLWDGVSFSIYLIKLH